MESYVDMQARHRKEIDALPICYAFNKEQLDEAKKTLGDVPLATFGYWICISQGRLWAYHACTLIGMKRSTKSSERTYKELEDGFLYEMSNHEFKHQLAGH